MNAEQLRDSLRAMLDGPADRNLAAQRALSAWTDTGEHSSVIAAELAQRPPLATAQALDFRQFARIVPSTAGAALREMLRGDVDRQVRAHAIIEWMPPDEKERLFAREAGAETEPLSPAELDELADRLDALEAADRAAATRSANAFMVETLLRARLPSAWLLAREAELRAFADTGASRESLLASARAEQQRLEARIFEVHEMAPAARERFVPTHHNEAALAAAVVQMLTAAPAGSAFDRVEEFLHTLTPELLRSTRATAAKHFGS
jgi:hypothetical protein